MKKFEPVLTVGHFPSAWLKRDSITSKPEKTIHEIEITPKFSESAFDVRPIDLSTGKTDSPGETVSEI